MGAYRYYAQRILGGTWLDRELDLYEVELTWALSGPGAMTATVDPELASRVASDGLLLLEEWSTAVYAERDNVIRWGGLLHSSAQEEGGKRKLDFMGFSGYPKGRIYDGDIYKLWEADPFDIVRLYWNYIQSDPYSNLGVTVDTDTCPVRIGDPSPGPKPEREGYPSQSAYEAALAEWNNYAGEPYELAWWLSLDAGSEIDNVMQEAQAQYYEEHSWIDAAKTQVKHHINLGWPHIGTRREDLRFAEGENILVPPLPERNGDHYASNITSLGNGEERHMLRSGASFVQSGKLRRDKVVGAQDVMSFNRLKALAEEELRVSRNILFFDQFEVIDHPNAPIGSFNVGDQIRVQTFSGFEKLDMWVLVTEMTMSAETNDSATVSVTRL